MPGICMGSERAALDWTTVGISRSASRFLAWFACSVLVRLGSRFLFFILRSWREPYTVRKSMIVLIPYSFNRFLSDNVASSEPGQLIYPWIALHCWVDADAYQDAQNEIFALQQVA
jgi:hypothetical protein